MTDTQPPFAKCSRGEFGGATARLDIRVDGKTVTSVGDGVGNLSSGETVERPFSTKLFEPGKDTTHTLTLSLSDTCGLEGGKSGAHFKVDSVSIDVVGLR
jgi:hypothetical protein